MEQHKISHHLGTAATALDLTFAAGEFEDTEADMGPKNTGTAEAAVQTEGMPSSALKVMMHEMSNLRTTDEAEDYRR